MERNRIINCFSTEDKESDDVIVYQCGMEKCKKSYSYGPAVRDHFLIHIVLKGKGRFYVDNKVYEVKQNEGFLICPDVITYYEADSDIPWTYSWVGFKGIKSEKYLQMADIKREKPVFRINDMPQIIQYLKQMNEVDDYKYSKEIRLKGLLLLFLSQLIEQCDNKIELKQSYKDMYIKQTLKYIEMNYNRNITVGDMAANIGINRNYLSSLFKESIKISPQHCLLKYRINKACSLLKSTALSISDISRSVGYSDPLGFSKMFKKEKSISPKKYRENHSDI